jgi:hypothetical protein
VGTRCGMREHAVGHTPDGSPARAPGVGRGHDIRLGAGRHGGRANDGRRDGVVERVVLTAEQRLAVERVVGIGVRWTVGGCSDLMRGHMVAGLHAVTRDGVVLGVALGTVLAAAEMDGWRPYRTLAEVYRDAGADEHVAAAELAWQRAHNPGRGSRG